LVSLLTYIIFKRLELVCVAYLGGICGRSERSQICRSLPNNLVVPVNLEVGQELRLCFLDQLLLVLLELELFVSRQGLPSRLYDIAGETLELSLEPAIEGRSDGSICVVPSRVAKKCVGTFSGANHYNENRRRCSLNRRGQSATWCRARVPCLTCRTIRALGPDVSDGPRPGAGRSARAQWRWSSPAAPGSRSWGGPRRGGEILGVV
jgi:hypothetical protein